MSLLTSAKHELKQVGLVTLYFMFCFAVILTLKKLFLAEYAIEFYALSDVVVGALVAGKVVLVLDHTPLGNLFDASQRPAHGSQVEEAYRHRVQILDGERHYRSARSPLSTMRGAVLWVTPSLPHP